MELCVLTKKDHPFWLVVSRDGGRLQIQVNSPMLYGDGEQIQEMRNTGIQMVLEKRLMLLLLQ
jgi:hypothetical protein